MILRLETPPSSYRYPWAMACMGSKQLMPGVSRTPFVMQPSQGLPQSGTELNLSACGQAIASAPKKKSALLSWSLACCRSRCSRSSPLFTTDRMQSNLLRNLRTQAAGGVCFVKSLLSR